MSSDPVELVLSKLTDAKRTRDGWEARCPVHDDRRASLSIAEGEGGRVLLCCHAGCGVEAICAALGLRVADLMPARNGRAKQADTSRSQKQKQNKPRAYPTLQDAAEALVRAMRRSPDAGWIYHTATGERAGVVYRWNTPEGKEIRPVSLHPDGWSITGMPTPRLLYRLPDLAGAKRVYLCEGEKAVEAARSLGLIATTSPHGAKSYALADWTPLAGCEVIALPDNDGAGEQYVEGAAGIVTTFKAPATVRVVRLPGLPEGGDIYDYVQARRGEGLPDDAIRAEVEAMADAAPTWTPTAAAAEQAAPATAGDDAGRDDEYQPFPTEALPPIVRDFVKQAATALGCDESYVALPLLAALASAVGNSRRVHLKGTWPEPCILWCAIVGDSGSLKSPAMDVATRPLHNLQRAAFAEWRSELEEYERRKALHEADAASWRKNGRKGGEPPPEPPDEPVCRRYVADDTTVEALAPLLQSNPRGLLVARDELSGWVNSFDAYKNSRGADVAKWLTIHGGRPLIVDRATGRRMIHVPRAAVSICGGVQPKALAAALVGRYAPRDGESERAPANKEHFENGLAARLIFAMPPRRKKRWTDNDLPDEAWAGIRYVFEQLLALPMDTDDNGDPVPVDLPLTPSGLCKWKQFYREHADEEFRLAGDLVAAWSKLEGCAARFALLVHLIRSVTSDATLERHDAIDEASVASGAAISRWAGDETARVYAVIGGDIEKPEARDRRLLLRIVRDHGGRLTARQLMHSSRRYRGSVAVAEQALACLAAAGLGTWGVDDHAGGPGRPVLVFTLHVDADDAGGPADAPPAPPTASDADESDGGNGDEVAEWTA